jgi:hypothetical protein
MVMYTYLRSVAARELLTIQAPALLASFLIAEAFYKFHSFTLECLAFLATWFVIDAVLTGVRRAWAGRSGRNAIGIS